MKSENSNKSSSHEFNMATYIITYKCPLSCPMCFFSCNPQRDETISQELSLKILDQIKELEISFIGIAGGEPFLKLNLMKELIKKAYSYGMTAIVVTSAYWGISYKKALLKLKNLKELGLNWIQISLDDQHQQIVPMEMVANVLKAALKLDFEDIKLIGSSSGNSENFKYQLFYLEQVLGIDLKRIDIIDRPRVSHQYFEDHEQVKYPFEELENIEKLDLPITKPGACLTELMIDVNGDLYPCCNNFIGKLGNVFIEDIQSIIKNLNDNVYFRIIKQDGPFKLARHLDETQKTNFVNKRYGSWCELCGMIFQKKEFQDLLTNK